jgi:hypothetical protein
MDMDLNGASRTSLDPGGNTWFPINRASGYGYTAEGAADDALNGGTNIGNGTDPVHDDGGGFGPGVSDDLYFAYQHHPGRGGIVGTTDVIGGVSAQVGSFNTLFPIFTPFIAKNAQYYKTGDSEEGSNRKHVYEGAGLDGNHGSGNFGVGGAAGQTATPNSYYLDTYNREWDFSIVHNVPYTDYKLAPVAADDLYWSTVPKFADLEGDKIPSISDEVRLLSVDCAAQTVTARSHLTGDYNFHRTDIIYANWTGDVKITLTGGNPETVDMTYDELTDTWSGSLSAVCVTDDTVTVTSYIGAGGSVNFTVP